MTEHDIALVRNSFRAVTPIADQAAALFYARLFELDPSFRKLFHGDREVESRQFMETMAAAVASLGDQDAITASFRDLGARYFSQGVRSEHYAALGTAFLWTLEKTLGVGFTPDVKYAWSAMYALLSAKMMEGARLAATAAA